MITESYTVLATTKIKCHLKSVMTSLRFANVSCIIVYGFTERVIYVTG